MNIDKKNQIQLIDKANLEKYFQVSKLRYSELNDVEITLIFRNQIFFTIFALLNLKSIFKKKRKYLVIVNLKKYAILSKLSEEHLTGWFGHELAHIVDYEKMSQLQLLLFAIRYIFDLRFRFKVEKRINTYAVNNGFALELFRVWKIFLRMETVNIKYKRYIIENYCPNWEDIKEAAQSCGINKQLFESLK